MCDNKIKRYELVELTVKSGQKGKINFQSIPQLRNQANQIIIIKAIDVFPDTDYEFSQFDNTVAGLPVALVKNAVLVLYINGEESVHLLPLSRLINTQDSTRPFAQEQAYFADLTNVDFDKSYVQLSAAPGTDIVIPFGIWYLRMARDMGGTMREG